MHMGLSHTRILFASTPYPLVAASIAWLTARNLYVGKVVASSFASPSQRRVTEVNLAWQYGRDSSSARDSDLYSSTQPLFTSQLNLIYSTLRATQHGRLCNPRTRMEDMIPYNRLIMRARYLWNMRVKLQIAKI